MCLIFDVSGEEAASAEEQQRFFRRSHTIWLAALADCRNGRSTSPNPQILAADAYIILLSVTL